jgi:regulator of RNase E activity RraB
MPDWPFYMSVESSGAICSTAINLSVKGTAPQPERPYAFWITLKMLQPNSNGLTSSAEAKDLLRIEAFAVARAAERMDAVFVAQLNRSGRFEMYFYAVDIANAESTLRDIAAAFPQYRMKCGGKHDPQWSGYLHEFYPTAPKLAQQILNFKSIEELKQNGDLSTSLHVIDHTARFRTDETRRQFIDLATQAGFRETASFDDSNAEGANFAAVVSNDMSIDLNGVNCVTWKLIDLAERCSGTYDGWGTETVVRCVR